MPEILETLLWVVAGGGAIIFLMGAIGNLVISLQQVLKKKHESLIPIIGGLAGMVAILVVPIDGVRRYWWIPLIADLGCLPISIWAIIWWRFARHPANNEKNETGID